MKQRNSLTFAVAAASLVAALTVSVIILSASTGSGAHGTGSIPALAATGPRDEVFEHAVAVALPAVVQIETDTGLGSGVVLDHHGDIVTNAHVVGDASRLVVTDARGHESAATVRGVFKPDDVAVIHTRAALHPATFGDSSQLRVGQMVLAIGNPLGLQSSATQGIISATSRTVSEGNGVALSSVIQTSAAVNPGNSGGALIDLRGRVVGIPTLAATDPELHDSAAPGIGFAISSNSVRGVVRQLVATGHVSRSGRAALGADLRSDPDGGALVAGVTPDGPAARAGIRAADVIVTVAGRRVATVDDVVAVLATLRPGRSVRVGLITSAGAHQAVRLTLGEA